MNAARGARGLVLALLFPIIQVLPAGAQCAPDRVEFRTRLGVTAFTVEIASTEAARERGLMGRRQLAPRAGMLFLFPHPGEVTFWMHDTPLPLDMIFLDRAGRVTRVHAHARPMDDSLIPGGAGVQAVVELNAGAAARAGIVPGSVIRAAAMPQKPAAWACPVD